MSKNTISLIAIIVLLIAIASIWLPKTPVPAPAASPANGLVNGTHTPANAAKPASESTIPPAAAPASQATPEPTASEPPKDKAMDGDDVPAGVDVAPTPNESKPADNKELVIPPSEGQ